MTGAVAIRRGSEATIGWPSYDACVRGRYGACYSVSEMNIGQNKRNELNGARGIKKSRQGLVGTKSADEQRREATTKERNVAPGAKRDTPSRLYSESTTPAPLLSPATSPVAASFGKVRRRRPMPVRPLRPSTKASSRPREVAARLRRRRDASLLLLLAPLPVRGGRRSRRHAAVPRGGTRRAPSSLRKPRRRTRPSRTPGWNGRGRPSSVAAAPRGNPDDGQLLREECT